MASRHIFDRAAAGALPLVLAATMLIADQACAEATDEAPAQPGIAAPAAKPMAKPASSAAEAVTNALSTLADQQSTLIEQQKMMIQLLQQKGMLTPKQATAMTANADKMAHQAQVSVAKVRDAMAAAPAEGQKLVPGAMNIPYVPERVRNQIRDQVKQEVMAQAKQEGWAAPGLLPDWINHVKITGDLRLRGESDMYEKGNSPDVLDFNSLLAAPFDVNQTTNPSLVPPTLNTQSDRDRFRVRARLGIEADITDGVTAEFRLATGNNTNPGTQNQTFGPDFNKDAVLFDRINIRLQPNPWLTLTGGRIPNLFDYTTLVWSNDLSFDGFEAHVDLPVQDGVAVFGTLGALPLQFTDLNFFSNDTGNKYDNFNKWLLAAQVGASWHPEDALGVRAAVAYYDFANYSGKESTPCLPVNTSAFDCNTDLTRPSFTQNGNTFFGLRNLSEVATGNPLPQLFGLAAKFDVLDINTAVDWDVDGPRHVVLNADYAVNLGYNAKAIQALPIENNNFTASKNSPTVLQSGNQAFLVNLTFGMPEVKEWLDWSVSGGYRYIEPDAVVAAFNDQDFHLGGTNAKGYTLIGSLGIAHNTWASVRWFSAHEVFGQPYGVDVLQLDLNTKF